MRLDVVGEEAVAVVFDTGMSISAATPATCGDAIDVPLCAL